MIDEITIKDMLALSSQYTYACEDFILVNDAEQVKHHTSGSDGEYAQLMDAIFLFIREGQGELEINGITTTVSAGDIVACRPNSTFRRVVEKNSGLRGSFIVVSRRMLMDCIPNTQMIIGALFNLGHAFHVLHLTEKEQSIFIHYATLLRLKVEDTTHAYRSEVIHQLVKCLICELIGAHMLEELAAKQFEVGQSEKLFLRFIHQLETTRPRPRFIEHYAAELCVTAKHLSEVCKKVSGRTALQWITEFITNDIRYHLLHTDLSIKEIVYQLQFPNSSFFGKYVRTHFGKSPSELRRSGGK
ncbi:MAG: helix-turn-helix domain-containing protein [Bacteroidaceae bacterium]|nr:helix-turn-helix domain-containing protein [Bacteroidaceae bacterium]